MRKCAFVFPGQSSQRKGMLAELYKESNIVRHTYEEASDIVGYNVATMSFEGKKEMLSDISISAPLILTASVASFRHLLDMTEIYPSMMAGHSLGEYSALTCANVFTLEKALPLVIFRSDIAQKIASESEGVMTVIFNISLMEIEEMCKKMRIKGRKVWISNNNSVNQVCVVGKECDVELVEIKASKNGALYKRIKGNAPYHSPMMDSVVEELVDFLSGCQINVPEYPVIASCSVRPYHLDIVIKNLSKQLTTPVKWFQTIDYIKRQNTNIIIELGSGQVLSRLINSTEVEVQSFSYETYEDRKQLLDYYDGAREVIK